MSDKLGVRIKWLGCASFEMDFGGLTVINDPYITANKKNSLTWEDVEKCDIITVTHSHFDHISDIPALIEKFDPLVLSAQMTSLALLKWTDMCPMKLYPANPGLEVDFDTIKIKALFGRHSVLNPNISGFMARAKELPWIGEDKNLLDLSYIGCVEYLNYLYTMPNGGKVLIWGNELTPDQCNILREVKPDIAILQMTKNSPKKTAELCKEMGCKVVISNHIDYPGDYMHMAIGLKEEMAKCAPEINCIIPEYGVWMEF